MRDFSPQHNQSISLCEALDRLLDTGVVVLGEVKLGVADVDLIYLSLQLVLTSIENGRDRATDRLANRAWPAGAGHADRPAGNDARYVSTAPPQAPNADARKPLTVRPPLSASTAACLPRPLPLRRRQAEGSPPANESELDRTPKQNAAQGLGQLVLTVIKLLHELLERQALRRIEGGALDAAQVERLGETLMKQAQAIEQLRQELGLQAEDLNLDLGPLGKLL